MIPSRGLIPGQTREQARAGLKPGNFQGRAPRGRSHDAEAAAMNALDDRWFGSSRFKRRAQVSSVERLTSTGTYRVAFEVVDGEPFALTPGQFVGIEAQFDGRGFRRSPSCVLSDPDVAPRFDLMIRAIPDGPLALHLTGLVPGDDGTDRRSAD